MKFYYGAASGSSRKALRQLEEPNVMINYATRNNKPWNGIQNLFIARTRGLKPLALAREIQPVQEVTI